MPSAKIQAESLNKMILDKATKHPIPEEDDDRLLFQHDRDRIVWSISFKRLAHKTQVFPQQYSDHHRRRLTHSLEVMQLSTSIARTLGLNFILSEAIALGHDLGHTPFGHAGEEALNIALKSIRIEGFAYAYKGLRTYTHYEQGIDVVSYADTRDAHDKIGLGLTKETQEGIFKHMYDYPGDASQKASLATLLQNTKYEFNDTPGSLEAQVVRICDKISYLISDIEDGLAIGAIHLNDLKRFDLFREAIENALKHHFDQDEGRIFAAIRNQVITQLAKSVLSFSSKKIDKASPKELSINLDEDNRKAMDEVFNNLQKPVLFEHFLVEQANKRARHIVGCLFCQYLRHPELIPWSFRSRYIEDTPFRKLVNKLYIINPHDDLCITKNAVINLEPWHSEIVEKAFCSKKVVQKPSHKLAEVICAKDFVSGMTDDYAEERYKNDVCCADSARAWDTNRWDHKRWVF